MNADPSFAYEQEMARVLGLEALHMADADVLPYDYVTYGKQVLSYLNTARARARIGGLEQIDFNAALAAANRFTTAAAAVYAKQLAPGESPGESLETLNIGLRAVEEDLLTKEGLPGRPWFKHAIYAPGEYTGYAAVVIPGVNEAIDAHDSVRAQAQMSILTDALNRAAATLEGLR